MTSRGQIIDLTGKHFGRLTVLRLVGVHKSQGAIWKCYCNCKEAPFVDVRAYSLKNGSTRSCGCLSLDLKSKRFKKMSKKFGHDCQSRMATKNSFHDYYDFSEE